MDYIILGILTTASTIFTVGCGISCFYIPPAANFLMVPIALIGAALSVWGAIETKDAYWSGKGGNGWPRWMRRHYRND